MNKENLLEIQKKTKDLLLDRLKKVNFLKSSTV